MKTISLKGIANPLSERELKKVKGGTPLTLIDDPGEGDLIADGDGSELSFKQKACVDKKLCDPCIYGHNKYGQALEGKCAGAGFGNPLHCTDMRCFS